MKRWCTKFLQVSNRNMSTDGKIPKISQKCLGKLRILNYFWLEKFWGSFWMFYFRIYTDGVFKWLLVLKHILFDPSLIRSEKVYIWKSFEWVLQIQNVIALLIFLTKCHLGDTLILIEKLFRNQKMCQKFCFTNMNLLFKNYKYGLNCM